jgi:hypothetical protein
MSEDGKLVCLPDTGLASFLASLAGSIADKENG